MVKKHWGMIPGTKPPVVRQEEGKGSSHNIADRNRDTHDPW